MMEEVVIIEKKPKKINIEKYLGLNRNKEYYHILEKCVKSGENNFKLFYNYLKIKK